MKFPKFGEYWVAEISFFPGNPISRYVVHVDCASKDEVQFTPFVLGESVGYSSKKVNSFKLVEKINMNMEVK